MKTILRFLFFFFIFSRVFGIAYAEEVPVIEPGDAEMLSEYIRVFWQADSNEALAFEPVKIKGEENVRYANDNWRTTFTDPETGHSVKIHAFINKYRPNVDLWIYFEEPIENHQNDSFEKNYEVYEEYMGIMKDAISSCLSDPSHIPLTAIGNISMTDNMHRLEFENFEEHRWYAYFVVTDDESSLFSRSFISVEWSPWLGKPFMVTIQHF